MLRPLPRSMALLLLLLAVVALLALALALALALLLAVVAVVADGLADGLAPGRWRSLADGLGRSVGWRICCGWIGPPRTPGPPFFPAALRAGG